MPTLLELQNQIDRIDVPSASDPVVSGVESVNGQTGIVSLGADDVGAAQAGDGVSIFLNDSGYLTTAVKAVVAGTNVTIDSSDPENPIISASGGGGSSVWGGITGTLSDQTDLQSALNLKADSSSLATVATSGAYSDLTGQPTAVSAFTNDAGYITGISGFSTADLAEGSNLYYTEARVSANASVVANTAKISYPPADASKLAGIAAGAQVNTIDAGDNVSELVNDAGYTDNTGTVESVVAGTNVTIDNTDPANPIVSSSGGGGGSVYSFNRVIGTGNQALTNAAVAVTWSASQDSSGSDVTWSGANPTRLTVSSDGVYRIGGYLTVQSAGQRAQSAAEILIDGVATGLQRSGTYMRNSGSAYDYWAMEITGTPVSLTAGQYVELAVGRVSGATYGYAGSLAINCQRNRSEFWLERVA